MLDQKKIDESFVKDDKGIFTPRSIMIRQRYKITKSEKFKQGCVLVSKGDYEYLLKMANETENERFK